MKNSNHQDVSYVAMRGDLINSGHINILTKASSLGRVVVGLLSDEAIESYKKGPFLKYEARYDIIKNIQLIDEIVEQSTLDYSENLEKFKVFELTFKCPKSINKLTFFGVLFIINFVSCNRLNIRTK